MRDKAPAPGHADERSRTMSAKKILLMVAALVVFILLIAFFA
ncbi:MAG TPA: hypothetical protein VG164_05420 [Trebonia sp.]|nr:hypothetical protein [Trebonia sp.]